MLKKPRQKRVDKKDTDNLTYAEHLGVLKKYLIAPTIIFLVIFIIAYSYSNAIMTFVIQDARQIGFTFVYLAPQEVLIQQLRIAFTLAVLVSIPLVIFVVYVFISPVITLPHKILKGLGLELASIFLYLVGFTFTYKILLPFTLRYLYSIGTIADINANISLENFISLFVTFMVVLGTIFELPLVVIILTKWGILNPNILKKIRPIVIVLIFVIAAIVTPPDVVSQLMVAVPMLVLFEISRFICRFIRPVKHNKDTHIVE